MRPYAAEMPTSLRRRRRPARILSLALVPLVVGALAAPASAVRTTTTQDGDITIGDPAFQATNGAGIGIPIAAPAVVESLPYPSDLTVTRPGVITDLNLTLLSVDHTFPDDVDILLVGPGGQQATVMSDVGAGTDIVNANITLDDEAGAPLPAGGPIATGTFQPTNGGPADTFPAPAPAPTGSSALSVFDGTSPVGTWRLFVVDDVGILDGGDISGGWTLTMSTTTNPYPSTLAVAGLGTVADVNITISKFSHTFPDDVDILLTGPGGQQATVMSDAGTSADAVDLNLTFDDEASAPLPDAAGLTSGTFQPTNHPISADLYPAPAPVSTGNTSLAVFDGTNPNGTWRLFVVDDDGTDLGTIDAWSLDIDWTEAVAPTGSVSISGGAAATKSAAVTLNLSAADAAPSTGVTQMRFSNDGVTFSDFRAFAATTAWTLSPGDGTKTVTAQFRDAAGNISAASTDTIRLDTTAPRASKVKPAKNATGVKPTAKVKVFATESLDKATVTKKTVVLKKGSKKVKAKVSYADGKHVITLKPNQRLSPGKYKVSVSTKVTDLVGNGLDAKPKPGAQALKWSFKV